LLLVHELNIIPLRWNEFYPIILLLIGSILLIQGIMKKTGGALFWGINLFGAGVFYSLRNYDVIPYYTIPNTWPIFSIILGLAFVSLFILNRKDWGVLIPGGLFLVIGLNYFLDYFNYWRLQTILQTYWPIALIVAGVIIILVNLSRKKTDEV